MDSEPKIWEKTLQNHEPYKWFDWIDQELKTEECRIYRGDWTKVKIGDIIYFTEEGSSRKIKTCVINLTRAKSFGEAFTKLGYRMVPIVNVTPEMVDEIYGRIFFKTEDKKDMATYGVISVGVCIIRE